MPGLISNSMVAFGGRGLLIDYLIVAGGGGGQAGIQFSTDAGAGGGGQVLFGTTRLRRGSNLNIVVGVAGAPGSFLVPGQIGGFGTSSSIATVGTAIGGLPGGTNASGVASYGWGGSDGGGHAGSPPGSGPSFDGGAAKAGGAGAGAGGGASGITPGPGIISSITGGAIEYGRGGLPASNGGDIVLSPPGRGGSGGKGNSQQTSGFAGVNGVVIYRYAGALVKTATSTGSITILGGFVIHTFTTNGNLIVL